LFFLRGSCALFAWVGFWATGAPSIDLLLNSHLKILIQSRNKIPKKFLLIQNFHALTAFFLLIIFWNKENSTYNFLSSIFFTS
jgi:hypothetical protein